MEPGLSPGVLPPGTLVERRLVTAELAVLSIARPAGFTFTPGQSVRIGLGGTAHPYSIASGPDAPLLELCIELVQNGRLTPRLFALRVGDRVDVAARAKGSLLLDPDVSDHAMFATVTGVAPFVSMLRHELAAPKRGRRFLLVHGARSSRELVYRSELERMARLLPSLRYVPALSQPEPGWGGELGRLPSISDRLVDDFGLEPGNCRLYACGNPAMVSAIAAQFESADVPVSTESYWKA